MSTDEYKGKEYHDKSVAVAMAEGGGGVGTSGGRDGKGGKGEMYHLQALMGPACGVQI